MTEGVEITVIIPESLVEQIDEILNHEGLRKADLLPNPRSYEAFVIQGIQNELSDLNQMIGKNRHFPTTGTYPAKEE